MKLIKIFIIALFLAMNSMPVNAIEEEQKSTEPIEENDQKEQKIFTIDECIHYALEHDPNIKVAKDKVDIQKSKVGQAKSDYFPTLGAGNGYTFSSNKEGNSSNRTNNSYNADVSVNQLIWNFGKSAANINMQKYNEKASEFDLEYEILATVYKVKMAYYEVLAAKANNDVSEKTVRINKLNYERTKALFDEGLKSKIDVVNAEVNYTDSKIRLLEGEHIYESALLDLANAMYYTDTPEFAVTNTENFNFKTVNYNPPELNIKQVSTLETAGNSELILTSGIEKHNILKDFNFKPYTTSVAQALAQAYQNRPDLKSLELVLKASGESLKAIKRSYYPELGASAGYNFQKNQDNYANGFRVYAGLDFPMINVMNIKHKIAEGKSYYDIAENNVDLSKKNIYFEVQNNYINMKQIERKIPLMANKVEQTLENFQLADGRYTVGLGNFLELQDAQTNYNNAQLEFIKCVFEYNVAREEFLKSMGVR